MAKMDPVATNSLKVSRKDRGKISPATRLEVLARDEYQCVRCGAREFEQRYFKSVPYFVKLEIHHIEYRSQLGQGKKRNLATACGSVSQSGTCHHWAQNTREGREWFERWADENLNEEGDRIR